MPPKKNEERRIQAVVLCDSYQPRFDPLTRTKPRCLLPLANVPLIEYTLEFLVSAKVSDVFLLCCTHAHQVSEYINHSKWSSPYVPLKISTIELPNTASVGDAMRDIDARGILKGDFLLISGDVVCNVDFDKIWAAHQKRRQQDKNCIMSIVLRQGAATHRTRSPHTGFYILESSTNRVVAYRNSVLQKSVSIDASDLLAQPAVEFRNDLIDCHIDICTLDVPALFQENFDYEHLRRDFVTGILTSDLLGKSIYADIITEDYAARVDSFKTYDAITKDIISRYTYPLVVDANEGGLDETYSYYKGNIYKEKDVKLSQSCQIEAGSVIGGKTCVGSGSVIAGSTLGRHCKVGNNVTIRGSYIWDNVVIADNAVIERSVIASDAIIGERARLHPGAVVAFGYHVGPDEEISHNVSLFNRTESSSSESESDESEDNLNHVTSTMDYLELSDDSISSARDLAKRTRKTTRSLSTTSALSIATNEDDEEDFFKEAVASINRSIVDNHSQDVAILELNTLRMTMNASHDKVQAAAAHALLSHIGHLLTQSDVKTATVSVFTTWSPLLKRITFDLTGQVDLATLVENECARRVQGEKMLFYAISTLYDTDVISETAVNQWWKQPTTSSKVRLFVAKWVEWLQNAEEESSDDDE